MEEEKISINLATENFKNNLITIIQESKLPIVNIFLVWQLLMKEIESNYNEVIKNENNSKEY